MIGLHTKVRLFLKVPAVLIPIDEITDTPMGATLVEAELDQPSNDPPVHT